MNLEEQGTDKGRDDKGRFLPGHRHSVGNKGGRAKPTTSELYFRAFEEAVPTEEWVKATKAILKKAQRGDVQAYRALAQYCMKMPAQKIEHDVEMIATAMTLDQWQEQERRRIAQVEEDLNVIGDGDV